MLNLYTKAPQIKRANTSECGENEPIFILINYLHNHNTKVTIFKALRIIFKETGTTIFNQFPVFKIDQKLNLSVS